MVDLLCKETEQEHVKGMGRGVEANLFVQLLVRRIILLIENVSR